MEIAGRSYLSYKKSGETTHFDAIVIGSGTGGLSVGAFLAKEGKRVLLLEQHYVIGGYTHAFQRNGYSWDVGLHYVGHVQTPGTTHNKVFRYISNDTLEWEPLDDVYDRAVFGDTEYEFPAGRENLRAKLKEYFPSEEDGRSIDRYFELLDEVQNLGPWYFAEKTLPPWLSKIVGGWMRKGLLKYSDLTTREMLETITSNTKLIGVLTAQYGDYGLEPSKSSFYMHALLANHYMEGAGYPVGGAPQLAASITPVIEEAGGVALFRARVKQIVVEGNTATGVEMEDGTIFTAPIVISNAGIVNTYGDLLPQEVAKRHKLDEQLKELDPSMAHVGLYVGVKEPTKNFDLPRCNYWIFPEEYDHDAGRERYTSIEDELPVSFASFPSAKDPRSEELHPGRTMAEVIILVPYDWFTRWEATEWHKRDEEYEALKERLGKKMMKDLLRVAPQLEGKIDHYEVSTPVTTRHFSAHPSGEIYGVSHTPKRFRQQFLRPHTPVKNLYLTGQDVITASIAGGTMGGLLCASAIMKKNLLWKVQKSIT